MSATPNLGLPYIEAGQAQKHVTHNEALRSLDTLVQLAILDRDLAMPPASPAEGQRWIAKTGATGAWSGHDNQIAAWQDGAWRFSAPATGWVAYVIDEEILVAWDGAAWNEVSGAGGSDPTELQNMTLLGVGTIANATNPLSAKLNNVLWSAKTVAEGGDGNLRYKLSKESAVKTLSILLQDNFIGCAEIGLTGDDDFHFKVSPDGTSWLEAIRIDRATGKISFPVSGGPRQLLTANRTYYVRTDGSDSNNGLTNSAGGAFATIQKAVDVVFGTLDLSGFDVTIQVGNGTYTGGVIADSPQVGKGKITFKGDSVTPSNVLISTANANNFNAKNGAVFYVDGFKTQSTTFGYALRAEVNSAIYYSNMEFGACASWHIISQMFAFVNALTGYTITGGAQGHLLSDGGWVEVPNRAVTLSGSLTFSSAFAQAQDGGVIRSFNGTAYAGGTITGTRYSSTTNSIIQTFGGGANHFPGNAAGTTATGGQYA